MFSFINILISFHYSNLVTLCTIVMRETVLRK